MKYNVTKTVSIVMVLILLLGALAGCGDTMYGDKDSEINSETKETAWCEAEASIKSTYLSLGYKEKSLSVVRMADFGDVYVGMVRTGEEYGESYETVGGLDFVYNYRYSSLYKDTQPIDVYYNGDCYKLSEAYGKKIISYEELFELFKMLRQPESPKMDIDESYDKEWYILITVTPSYNNKEYTVNDFETIGNVLSVKKGQKAQSGLISKSIILTLDAASIADLSEIVENLEMRPDTYDIWVAGAGFTFLDDSVAYKEKGEGKP